MQNLIECDPLEIEDMAAEELMKYTKTELVDLIRTQANALNFIESRTGLNAVNCEDPQSYTGGAAC